MPLYEYECDACGHRFEVIQKFSDPRVEVCPKCGGAVRKLLASPAIQFKGSGWYITDYARKGAKEAPKDETAGAKEGGQAAGAKDAGGSRPPAGGEAPAKTTKTPESSPAPAAEKD